MSTSRLDKTTKVHLTNYCHSMRKFFLTLAVSLATTIFAQANTTAADKLTEVPETEAVTECATEVPTQKLGIVEYKHVDVNGKLRKRYVCGDVVMTSKEFTAYCKANCPQSYKHMRKSIIYYTISIATCWTLTINWGFLIAGSVQAEKALPAYNEYCAEK